MIAINVPQSKTVTIAFLSLKANLLGILTSVTALDIVSSLSYISYCNLGLNSYFLLVRVFFVFSFSVDLLALSYFVCSSNFKKVIFYVFYIYHWIFSLIALIGGITNFVSLRTCLMSAELFGAFFAINVILQANIIVALASDLFLALKYLHFGSNLVWTLAWVILKMGNCSQISTSIIGVTHAALACLNLTTFLSTVCLGNGAFLYKKWRFLTVLSILLMILCYLVNLIGQQQIVQCPSLKFFMRVYTYFGLFEIIPPLFLLLSLRGQNADPRDLLVKNNPEAGQEQLSRANQQQLRDILRLSQQI